DFPKGWQLGEPDIILTMAEAFPVPADGPDIYRNFVLPIELEEDRWVTAVELRTTAPTSVHHCLYFLDDTGDARKQDENDPGPGFERMGFRRTGDLGGWAVGATPRKLPAGLARTLTKGSDLILSMHFHPSGKPEKEKARIGLYFAEKPPERTLVGFMVPPQYGARAGINIPAGEADFRLEETIRIPVDVELVLASGHAHYLCRSMRADAVDDEGNSKPLLSIPRWDFNWQGQYEYSKFLPVAAGTEIRSLIVYDNSEANLANPFSPPQRVTWGLESNDEMGSVIFHAVPKNEDDAEFLWLWSMALEWGGGRRDRGLLRRIKQADPNGDGVIEKKELKDPISRAYFNRLDFNGDGVINYKEINDAFSKRKR
ncbi:MAG: EF-hand domain-containing protein, partial [Planctomycetota bacterium]